MSTPNTKVSDENDKEMIARLFKHAEHRVSHAENTPGYNDFDFVEKALMRLRPCVLDNQENKEKWKNLVARLNKLRYG